MLRAAAAKVEEDLAVAMDVLAESLDTGHVLVQSDAANAESRPADPEILEENGLKFFRHHKTRIAFVLIKAFLFSPQTADRATLSLS
jgi:hypothetical protein